MQIRLKKEQKIIVENPEDIFKIMRQILRRENKIGRGKEHFWVVGLATNSRIVFIELVSLGHLNKSVVDAGEVFQLAIHKDAPKVILVHNHPLGDLDPSEADKDITDKLIQAGRIVSKDIVDHLIISETEYYSFVDSGLLEELRQSKKYVVRYLEEKRIREEGIEIGKEAGEKKQALEIANKAIREGFPREVIVKLTGLSVEEIEKIENKTS